MSYTVGLHTMFKEQTQQDLTQAHEPQTRGTECWTNRICCFKCKDTFCQSLLQKRMSSCGTNVRCCTGLCKTKRGCRCKERKLIELAEH